MTRVNKIAVCVAMLFALVAGVVIGTVIAPKDPTPEPEEHEIIVQLIIDKPKYEV